MYVWYVVVVVVVFGTTKRDYRAREYSFKTARLCAKLPPPDDTYIHTYECAPFCCMNEFAHTI